MSECISPGWSNTEDNPSDWSGAMRLSYIVLKFFLAFELGCSSLRLMLDIIAFLPCLTREDCSFLRLLLLVSDLDVPLNNSSSHASASECSEVLRGFSTPSCSKSSPGSCGSSWWWWSGRISVCSPSSKGSVGVMFASPASAFRPSSPSRFLSLLSFFRSLKDHYDLHSLLHKQKRRKWC